MSPGPPSVHDVGPEEARRLTDGGAVLLDVREDDEWEAGHAPGAVHLPMGVVADRIDEIPADRIVLCVCRVGARSGTVASALSGAGYEVHNVDGGMVAWEAGGLPVVTDDGGTGRII